jgi:hypothetical protein
VIRKLSINLQTIHFTHHISNSMDFAWTGMTVKAYSLGTPFGNVTQSRKRIKSSVQDDMGEWRRVGCLARGVRRGNLRTEFAINNKLSPVLLPSKYQARTELCQCLLSWKSSWNRCWREPPLRCWFPLVLSFGRITYGRLYYTKCSYAFAYHCACVSRDASSAIGLSGVVFAVPEAVQVTAVAAGAAGELRLGDGSGIVTEANVD